MKCEETDVRSDEETDVRSDEETDVRSAKKQTYEVRRNRRTK